MLWPAARLATVDGVTVYPLFAGLRPTLILVTATFPGFDKVMVTVFIVPRSTAPNLVLGRLFERLPWFPVQLSITSNVLFVRESETISKTPVSPPRVEGWHLIFHA